MPRTASTARWTGAVSSSVRMPPSRRASSSPAAWAAACRVHATPVGPAGSAGLRGRRSRSRRPGRLDRSGRWVVGRGWGGEVGEDQRAGAGAQPMPIIGAGDDLGGLDPGLFQQFRGRDRGGWGAGRWGPEAVAGVRAFVHQQPPRGGVAGAVGGVVGAGRGGVDRGEVTAVDFDHGLGGEQAGRGAVPGARRDGHEQVVAVGDEGGLVAQRGRQLRPPRTWDRRVGAGGAVGGGISCRDACWVGGGVGGGVAGRVVGDQVGAHGGLQAVGAATGGRPLSGRVRCGRRGRAGRRRCRRRRG